MMLGQSEKKKEWNESVNERDVFLGSKAEISLFLQTYFNTIVTFSIIS